MKIELSDRVVEAISILISVVVSVSVFCGTIIAYNWIVNVFPG